MSAKPPATTSCRVADLKAGDWLYAPGHEAGAFLHVKTVNPPPKPDGVFEIHVMALMGKAHTLKKSANDRLDVVGPASKDKT